MHRIIELEYETFPGFNQIHTHKGHLLARKANITASKNMPDAFKCASYANGK